LKRLLCILLVSTFWSCQKDDGADTIRVNGLVTAIPEGFPEVVFPADNPFTLDRWKLGKKLFYDPALSRDSSISCASCHKASQAFSDNVAFSKGAGNTDGTRNSPSLANVAYHPYFTREGGIATLEGQILVPFQEHNEFDFNIVDFAEKLQEDDGYVALFETAYERVPDPYSIVSAIATFERTLISGNSAYDQFEFKGKISALSASQIRGMKLFFSDRTNCSDCHSEFNFTNYQFQNNGLYAQYADNGRMRLTGNSEDEALFKVPGLRNVALTGPYMHNGSMQSLEEVVLHYNSGGQEHPNKSHLIRSLGLNVQEMGELVQFLEALTDYAFINNTTLQNEKE